MKKIFILLFVAFLTITDGFCNISFTTSNNRLSNREVIIRVLVIGGGKSRPRPRSAQAEIEAEIDLAACLLFVEFNDVVGRVTIQVKNSMGQIINSYTCDTKFESTAIIGISDSADNYSISIIGEDIEAYGDYEITE